MKPDWTHKGDRYSWNLGLVSVTIARPDSRTIDKKWIIQFHGQQSKPYCENGAVKLFDDNTPPEDMMKIAEQFAADVLAHDIWKLPEFPIEKEQ